MAWPWLQTPQVRSLPPGACAGWGVPDPPSSLHRGLPGRLQTSFSFVERRLATYMPHGDFLTALRLFRYRRSPIINNFFLLSEAFGFGVMKAVTLLPNLHTPPPLPPRRPNARALSERHVRARSPPFLSTWGFRTSFCLLGGGWML